MTEDAEETWWAIKDRKFKVLVSDHWLVVEIIPYFIPLEIPQ